MVKVEKSSESTAVPQVSAAREVFKLNAGDRIRGIVIDNVMAAKSEYGEFMVMNFTTEENEQLAFIAAPTTVWGRNCIETFADTVAMEDESHTYSLKSKFQGVKVWIGKSMPIPSGGKGNKTYMQLEWGFEE